LHIFSGESFVHRLDEEIGSVIKCIMENTRARSHFHIWCEQRVMFQKQILLWSLWTFWNRWKWLPWPLCYLLNLIT